MNDATMSLSNGVYLIKRLRLSDLMALDRREQQRGSIVCYVHALDVSWTLSFCERFLNDRLASYYKSMFYEKACSVVRLGFNF